MKYFIVLFIFLIITTQLYSEWEHRFSSSFNYGTATYANKLFIGRNNGISAYNLDKKEVNQYTMLNSDLPGNRINSLLKLSDNKILVSTHNGLALILNGVLTIDDPICKNYPDSDSRKLYIDSLGRIWTYSSNHVYYYDNGVWKSINLKDSISYNFDIWELFINHNNVWALYNDVRKTSTQFYERSILNLQIRIAVINDSQILNILDSTDVFPVRQGSYSVVDAGDFIVWKNCDSVYIYKDGIWTSTNSFNDNANKPYNSQDLKIDKSGHIWYSVCDDKSTLAYPVSYNIKTGDKTTYLQNENEKWIWNINVLENGDIAAISSYNIYLKKDTGWIKINKADFGLDSKAQFGYPVIINGKIYVNKYHGGSLPDGTLFCVENGSQIPSIYKGIPFSNLNMVEINRFGKGIFRGVTSLNDQLQVEADSAFVNINPLLITNSPMIKTAQDGNIYFTGLRVDNTLKSNFLATWEGNDLVKIDMGFGEESTTQLQNFDVYGDFLFGLGFYKYGTDSLNSYLSIYNIKNKTLLKYDKHNSDMPDYITESSGLSYNYADTVPQNIAVDKDLNPWILTSKSLMKFSTTGSEIFDLSYHGVKLYLDFFVYDNNSNELIISSYNYIQNYYFDIISKNIDSMSISESGIKGNLIQLKKLTDNNIWASDDSGYLYRYKGKGKFEIFNLSINNKDHLGFPLNDFSIDYNKNLHLATEIGLLTNNTILSDVKENFETLADELKISPNPARDYIYIQPSESFLPLNSSEIEIFDLLGTVVNAIHPMTGSNRMNIEHLMPGLYFVKIGNRVEKFVKI